MNTTSIAISPPYDDDITRRGQPYLVYPVFFTIAVCLLFRLGGGGSGARNNNNAEGGSLGFNTQMPSAENTSLKQPSIERPSYAKAEGQILSSFTHTQKLPVANGLRELPSDETTANNANVATPLAQNIPTVATSQPASAYVPSQTVKGSRTRKRGNSQGFQYHAPRQPYYVGTNQTDQQLESQLSTYQAASRPGNQPTSSHTAGQSTSLTEPGSVPNLIQLADNTTATRLAEPTPVLENPFNTAEVGPTRRESQKTSLQTSGYNRRAVATMIPAVIHDDQSVRPGQPVKLRLTKAIVVDGINVPANTIVHATCKPEGDRIYLIIRSLQLNSQLIPLDLEAVDLDGGTGVNAPGLSEQLGGQLKSSAVQGVQVPTGSMLVNTVLNTARFGASSAVRKSMIHLKGGYHLFLKSI
ncbi:conjugative transposon protein TraM [Larkinella sp. C7]|uniref:conjugative transposon protein TraM n=1 Tax=Larkinella sp. C7 TaxID=2576607 RepID=UPI0011115BD2|nr:conjugative transposon protein TraM [Larkinella sp. C7]